MIRARATTFASIESDSRLPAAEACWHCAEVAGDYANFAANRRSRRTAQSVMCREISRAIELAPERLLVEDASKLHLGLLGLRFDGRNPLFVRAAALSPRAFALVLRLLGFADIDPDLGGYQ